VFSPLKENYVQPIPSTRVNDVSADSLVSHGRSAASWGAIFAGAVVAISAFLVLLTLGAGIDFASISPWAGQGVSSTTFNVMTAIWLIVTQWISAGLGGYVAGRLRTRWVGTHTHEVFFRDTAHGLVTWSLATVVVAAIAASSISSLLSGGAHAAAGGANSAMSAASGPSTSYDIDKLFRSSTATSSAIGDARTEAGYIFANALRTGNVPDADRTYLASMIAQKTGVAQDDAQKRVDEAIARINEAKAKAMQAADQARKAAAETAIYTALSMLIGAFIASVSAALGGRLRDEHI
jgi:hypothetical protein